MARQCYLLVKILSTQELHKLETELRVSLYLSAAAELSLEKIERERKENQCS